MKKILGVCLIFIFGSSCASKKEILYLQDVENYDGSSTNFVPSTIQANDILNITVTALVAESAKPYNMIGSETNQGNANVEALRFQGYLVSENETINFPVLGELSTKQKTILELQNEIKTLLESGGHLINPFVDVKVINAKFTVLGEVSSPGTYNLAEQNITLLQALGYAGDLTINGKREDILLVRTTDGVHKVTHVDITSAEFITNSSYFIRANDVIYVNPNNPQVKKAGFISNPAALLSLVTLVLTTAVLITR